jgi:hypothetical protein
MPITTTFLGELQQLVSLHGYWMLGLIVGLESLGLPLPGETMRPEQVQQRYATEGMPQLTQ